MIIIEYCIMFYLLAYTKAHPILYVLLGISLLAKLIKNIFDD